MEHVSADEIEPQAMGGDVDRRGLADPLGTTDVAINRYVLDPGEAFSGGLHAHLDQEEVFYVVEGTATFEHRPDPAGESEMVTVGPDEVVRFAPGEYQQGRNESDDRVVALALGAPMNSTEGRVAQPCPDCDSDVLTLEPADEGFLLVCPDCGTELEPDL
ncbi:cupin domain-containing protein [Haloarcula argentinensis]|uniref:Cupin n=1 Tax=Haloarcula argentinensis TaxID=43776 RepID=A0A830FTE6_HALAR|nr:cupin domain-containing protein [Haloarcula argentinensis]GGM37345.1 cupin [Haloarcula argentinensis]